MERTKVSISMVEKRRIVKSYTCELCEFSCSSSIALQRHRTDTHSSVVKRPFKCSYCDFEATTCEKLKVHRKVHGVPGSNHFKCSKCSAQFTHRSNLKDHFNKHTGLKPYGCKLCHFKSFYRPILAAHMLKHDPSKQIRCSQCEYVTHCKIRIKRHVVVHHSEAPFIQCTETGCKYKTKDKNYMTVHINGVHKKDVHYRCKLCAKGFYAKGSFENHFRTHTGERPFKCDLCSYSGGNSSALLNHRRIHSADHKVQCLICQKFIRSKYALKSHLKTHSESRQFPCPVCPHRADNEWALQQHMTKTHKPEEGFDALPQPKIKKNARTVPYIKVRIRNVVKKIKSYQCSFCDLNTNCLSSYNSHVRRHTGEKPYKCDQCDYSSDQHCNLLRHKLQQHHKAELPLLSCTHCKFQTKNKDSLRLHERRHFFKNDKTYNCSQCSYTSRNNANLEIHIRRHTGERPFPCSLCSYRAPSKHCLDSHLSVHSQEKPLQCPLCDYRAKTSNRMRQHRLNRHDCGRNKTFVCAVQGCASSYKIASKLRDHVRSKHDKETRFKCSLCSKAFFHNYDLTRHLRTHTGEKPHKCDVCSYTAASSSEVINHKKLVHFPSSELGCSECDRTFKSQASLNRHLEFHSLDRQHPCPFCAYRALTKQILKPHLESCLRRWKLKDKNYGNKNTNNSSVGAFSKQTERLLFVKFGCKPCTVRVERLGMTK